MKTLLAVMDLGSFKAYTFDAAETDTTPRLERIQDFETVDAHNKSRNTLTILEGQQAQAGGKPGFLSSASDGEQHDMKLEKEKRLIKQLAQTLENLLDHDEIETCLLAVPAEIHRQFLNTLPSKARKKIERVLPLDLTKVPKRELLDHFATSEDRELTLPLSDRRKRLAGNQGTHKLTEIRTRRGASPKDRRLLERFAHDQRTRRPALKRRRGEPAPIGGFRGKQAAQWSAYRENLSNVKRKPEARRPPAAKKSLERAARTGRQTA